MDSKSSGEQERSRVLVRTLACVLQKLVDVNRKLDTPSTQVITKFHASRPPSISVADYLERINKYASCSPECLVLALIYVDRLIQQGRFALTPLNVHRVLITAVMLAAKFFDDQYFNNLYYAKVGGVPCKEINSLEVEFLFLVNFSLHVPGDVYARYHTELLNHAHHAACPCCGGGASLPILPSGCAASAVAVMPRVPSPVYAPVAVAAQAAQPRLAATGFGVVAAAPAQPVPVPVAHATAGAMQALLAAQEQQLEQQQQQEAAAVAAACSSIAGVVLRGLGGGRSVSPVMVQPPVTPPAHHPHSSHCHQLQQQPAFTSYFSYDETSSSAASASSSLAAAAAAVASASGGGFVGSSSGVGETDNPQAPLYAPVPHYTKAAPALVPPPAYYPHEPTEAAHAAAAAAAAFWDGSGSGSGCGGRASSVTPTPGAYASYHHGVGVEQGTVLVHPQRMSALPSGGSGLQLEAQAAAAAQAAAVVAAKYQQAQQHQAQQAQQHQQQQALLVAASEAQAAAAVAEAAMGGYAEPLYGGPATTTVASAPVHHHHALHYHASSGLHHHHHQAAVPSLARGGSGGGLAVGSAGRVLMQYPACYGVQVLMNT